MPASRTRGHRTTRWLSCDDFVRQNAASTHGGHHETASCFRKHNLRTVLEIEVKLDGAVVGTEDFGVYFGGGDPILEGIGDEEVVQTPTDVLLAGVEAVGPP